MENLELKEKAANFKDKQDTELCNIMWSFTMMTYDKQF